ncbi:hypothetical protein RvVAT039_11260 [Agrobacterium vitis]|uniref:hypothetical protein n=1 Tax=Agrobacterium vitis TaxID=373 RepID=UPI0015DB936D|nr:hypothetical protein [Agrobacterium vitis]BCH63910.1 hypothetical protein RvVAT039_11260 [Agrobacterium vitis]
MAKRTSNSTARELYRSAVAMHEMTKLAEPHIKPKNEKQHAVYIGYYFNLGFSIELYLKAFLRDKTGEDVSKYGHDLGKVFNAATASGFEFEKDKISQIINIIGDAHRSHIYRYAEGATEFEYINERHLVEIALNACSEGMSNLR